MPEELIVTPQGISPAEAPPTPGRPDARRRWFELSLVLLVAFAGPIFRSTALLQSGPDAHSQIGSLRWIDGMVQEGTSLLLLGYVLARRNLRLSHLGLRWSLRDLGTGVGVAFLSYFSYAVGFQCIHLLQHAFFPLAHNGPTPHQIFGHPPLAAIPFSLINPFFEELTVRAYLMTEIAGLTGSWMLAAAVSVVLQTSYHLYYGWAGAFSLSFQFFIFAFYYARTRKATPIILAHGIFDIWALIRLW